MRIENLQIITPWSAVLDNARFTMNKPDINKEPTDSFKEQILISEHSPIRSLIVKWDFVDIPYFVMVHLVRHHIGVEKFVTTSRSDRTGISRDELKQTDLVSMRCEANVQALINISKVRLCYQASKETRQAIELLKLALRQSDPKIADMLVPSCVYRCGCPEPNSCGICDNITPFTKIDLTDIATRYSLYNNYFYTKNKKEVI